MEEYSVRRRNGHRGEGLVEARERVARVVRQLEGDLPLPWSQGMPRAPSDELDASPQGTGEGHRLYVGFVRCAVYANLLQALPR